MTEIPASGMDQLQHSRPNCLSVYRSMTVHEIESVDLGLLDVQPGGKVLPYNHGDGQQKMA